ncbi:peptidylprolyl isomerase [Metabacillus litoralis]|uniref:Peptidylprolyl isomerase n=1 Tax=Metabacillus litoralis TaxID=152268 RepID=A0A5C6W2K8_9BACI|nr:SurA N-terminal domain-containing protein [Metabacillus litoralis]TXC91602.1 peptidylprolyl isomerase [Metabacillus litoralis]
MKKLLLTLFISLLALSLAACNNDEEKQADDAKTTEKVEKTEEAAVDQEEMQKKLDKQKVEADSVVAIVNGQEIKGTEFNDALSLFQSNAMSQGQDVTNDELAKQLKDSSLDFIVGQTLIMQEVDKKGYTASEEEIDKALETEKARFKTEEEFEAALKESELTVEDLKSQISDNVKITQYLDKDVKVEKVTDDEVKKYYDSLVSANGESEETPKFEDVKETLKANLEQQKSQQEISAKIEELRKGAEIDLKI